MVLCFCLIVFKIPINIAVGAVELDGVGAAGRRRERNDDYLLHGGVHHGAVHHKAYFVVYGDAHIAEVLVEADIDGIVTGTSYNGVRTYAIHQRTSQINFVKSTWHIDIIIKFITRRLSETNCLYFYKTKPKDANAN